MTESNTFPKRSRIRGKKRIDNLFLNGESGFCHPFRYVYTVKATNGDPGVSVLVSVPKRHHKKAVARNLLKRRTREVFRIGKCSLEGFASGRGLNLDIALLYSSKHTHDYSDIERSISKILDEIHGRI